MRCFMLLLFAASCAGQIADGPPATPDAGSPADAPPMQTPSYATTTKTPYQPQQDMASYEPAPAGYAPVFTELVARHGSRGLSSFKDDAALYNLWLKAQADGALTDLGQRLGPDLMTVIKTNALLGYGNLTALGVAEHQGLAMRLAQRMPAVFVNRQVIV